jgi:hypothetical protein
MLVEKSAKPTQSGFLRRWLTDDFFDLIVWYEPGGNIHGFQLCYDKQDRERAFTWQTDRGFTHSAVDGGEFGFIRKGTPILAHQGDFPSDVVRQEFLRRGMRIDPVIYELVLGKIDAFITSASNGH